MISPGKSWFARRVLGAGVDPRIFETRFDALGPKEVERLRNAVQRAWLTHAFRYHMRRKIGWDPAARISDLDSCELPSMEVVYLFTCLDTLAGSSSTDFPAWLQSKKTSKKLSLDTKEWSLDEVVAIYNVYKKELGVGANLRKLFSALLADEYGLADWLGEAVRVVKRSKDFSEERDLAGHEAIHYLFFEHFYNRRRNKHTHESKTTNIMVTDDIHWGEGWSAHNDTMFHDRKSHYMSLYIRNGIDEATLLRVILYVAVCHYLGIGVTPSMIDKYFGGLSRQSTMFGFLNEVRFNQDQLHVLRAFLDFPTRELETHFYRAGLPRLNDEWAMKLVERFDTTLHLEMGLREYTTHYAQAVAQINSLITSLEDQYPPVRDHAPLNWEMIDARKEPLKLGIRAILAGYHYESVVAPGAPESTLTTEHLHALENLARVAENPWYN